MRLTSIPIPLLLTILLTPLSASAQFGFFDQMFGNSNNNQGGSHQHHHHHQQQQQQNVRSDSAWYQQQYDNAPCTNYLCPGTLSCVHFPHHCPCAWDQEEKVELGDGIAVCASRGGWKAGETTRKIELARKGML